LLRRVTPTRANWEGSKQETPKARTKYHLSPRTKAEETQLNAADHEKQRGEKNPKLLIDSKLLVEGAEVYGIIGWLKGWSLQVIARSTAVDGN
jgi:hypothetical protein